MNQRLTAVNFAKAIMQDYAGDYVKAAVVAYEDKQADVVEALERTRTSGISEKSAIYAFANDFMSYYNGLVRNGGR